MRAGRHGTAAGREGRRHARRAASGRGPRGGSARRPQAARACGQYVHKLSSACAPVKGLQAPAVAAAAIIPLYAAYALSSADVGADVDVDARAREWLEQAIREQRDGLSGAGPEEREEIGNKIDGLEDMRDVLDIGERMRAADGPEMPGLLTELDTKLGELKGHAGNRSVHAVLTPGAAGNSTPGT